MVREEPRMPGYVVYAGYDRDLAKQSVGTGWSGLIDIIFHKIQELNATTKIIQVKEKYGGLRVYTDYINDELDNIITEVERTSFTICEECGNPGQLRDGSWYKTLCDEHANGRKPINPF